MRRGRTARGQVGLVGLIGQISLVTLCTLLAGSADADTIYLKNGRVIQCDWTRVEGENLVFGQYGGEVKIPLQAVDRVEEDSETGPAPAPTPSQEQYRAELVRRYAEAGLSSPVRGAPGNDGSAGDVPGGGSGAQVSAASGAGAKSSASGRGPTDWRELSPDTPEYWQLRMAEIQELIGRVQAEIDRLPKYNFLEEKILDGRILWVVQEKERLEARVRELQGDLLVVREDARKSGIPPGWLRLPTREKRR